MNIFLVDSKEARVRTRTSLKSRLEKPRVVEFSLLWILLPEIIALLKVKSWFGLLKIAKTCKKCF